MLPRSLLLNLMVLKDLRGLLSARSLFSVSLSLFLIAGLGISRVSYAQNPSDTIISLEPGLWTTSQTISFSGVNIPDSKQSGSHCLLPVDADLTVQQYYEKRNRGLSVGTNCSLLNVRETAGKVAFDVTCLNEIGVASSMAVKYEFDRTHVSASESGAIGMGSNMVPTQVTALSERVGECNDAQTAEAKAEAEAWKKKQAERQQTQRKSPVNGARDGAALNNANAQGVPVTGEGQVADDRPPTKGPNIATLTVADLDSYLKSPEHDKPVIVSFSSEDADCPPCVKHNADFQSANDALHRDFSLVQIMFSPWHEIEKNYKGLRGLPAVKIFDAEAPLAVIMGKRRKLAETIQAAYAKTSSILNDEFNDVAILKLAGSALDSYSKKPRGEITRLVHVTLQPTEACRPCVVNSKFIRAASREYSSQLEIAEISYANVDDMSNDKELHRYLDTNGLSVSDLPATLILEKSGEVSLRAGVWPTIIRNLRKVLK